MVSIPVNKPILNGNEKNYLIKCIETGWISSEGPYVKQLENQVAARIGRKYGVAVSNGSAALDIAVTALDIGIGDEVILPTFTIISCAAAIVRSGARPVVIDCDPNTWNMDVNIIEEKITKNTKAIMVVHIYGLPVDMDPVLKIAEKHGLIIIEDSAEAIGQNYKSLPCGSFGTISTFSFYPNKHITTGEGGMILSDDKMIAERCRSLRNLCFQRKKRFVHEELGWNYRMSNVQAALGVAQIERLDEFIDRKRHMGYRYTELTKDIKKLQHPLPRTNYAENIYWVYGLILKDEAPFDADEIRNRLAKFQIGTRPFFWPIHEQPVFRKKNLFSDVSCPVAERIARRGFYLPSGLALTDQEMFQVINALHQVIH